MEKNNNPLESTQMEIHREYNFGIDIIRIIAMFFVILFHSTMFYGFTKDRMDLLTFICAGFGRYLSYSCVPLFIVLTGYLNYNKTPSLKYFLKLIKFLSEFFICGIVIFLFKKVYFGDKTSFLVIIKSIIKLEYPSYSWYINMFVGLFLLTPFLNYVYKSLEEKYKYIFIAVLLFIFSNCNITTYWSKAFPLLYYFIGCMIRDSQIKIKKRYLIVTIILMCLIQLMLVTILVNVSNIESYNNLGCIIITISIFLLFYDFKIINISKSKNILFKVLRIIANASMSTYLISEIFEQLNYRLFDHWGLTSFPQKYLHLLYLTPLKFLASVICGIIINIIATYLYKLFIKFLSKNKKIKPLLCD